MTLLELAYLMIISPISPSFFSAEPSRSVYICTYFVRAARQIGDRFSTAYPNTLIIVVTGADEDEDGWVAHFVVEKYVVLI